MNSYNLSQREKNNERNKRIAHLHETGTTCKDIAKMFNLTESRVAQICNSMKEPNGKCYVVSSVGNVIYPGLAKWMYENEISMAELNRRLPVPYSYTHFRSIMNGRTVLSKAHIDELIAVTGCTYDELFNYKGE